MNSFVEYPPCSFLEDSIESIKKYWDYDNELFKFGYNSDGQPPNALVDNLITALEYAFHDNMAHWISYYIYELDFGSQWEEDSIVDEEGNTICLSSVQYLYKLLTMNKEN